MHVLDRIERKVLLNAPRKQVLEALTDAEQFGNWFSIALKGKTFAAGETLEAPITYPGYEHVVWKPKSKGSCHKPCFPSGGILMRSRRVSTTTVKRLLWWSSPSKIVRQAFY